jgi:hypothetical protein
MGLRLSQTMSPVEKAADDALDQYVEQIMTHSNLTLVPDSIERRVYKNMLKKAISDARVILETVRFEFLGHTVTLHVTPPE